MTRCVRIGGAPCADGTLMRQVLSNAHEWLERVDQTPGGYFGLDHKIGENVGSCQLCTAFASLPNADVARLRALIARAPHAPHCEAGAPMFPGSCSCWKKEA